MLNLLTIVLFKVYKLQMRIINNNNKLKKIKNKMQTNKKL